MRQSKLSKGLSVSNADHAVDFLSAEHHEVCRCAADFHAFLKNLQEGLLKQPDLQPAVIKPRQVLHYPQLARKLFIAWHAENKDRLLL